MKATGMVRRVDQLGRLCLPKELRDKMGMQPGAPVEMYVGGDGEVVLKKYDAACVFCGKIANETFKGQYVCEDCMEDMIG